MKEYEINSLIKARKYLSYSLFINKNFKSSMLKLLKVN